MKLPRDLSGEELAKLLKKYGYEITRQTGSHMRLTTKVRGEHNLTIPRHVKARNTQLYFKRRCRTPRN